MFLSFSPPTIRKGRVSPIHNNQEEEKIVCVRHLHRPMLFCIFLYFFILYFAHFLAKQSGTFHNMTAKMDFCMQGHRSV